MSTSRRNFLRNGTMVALAAGVPLSLAGKGIAGPKSAGRLSSPLTKNMFAALLDSEFSISSGGAKVPVRLIEISDLGRPAEFKEKPGKEGFSLVFRGDRSKPLSQNTYVMGHEKLGNFSFLLTPTMSKDKSALYYEVVVNRLYP